MFGLKAVKSPINSSELNPEYLALAVHTSQPRFLLVVYLLYIRIMNTKRNQYDKDEHDSFVVCPKKRCQRKNAPPESDEFAPNCWHCGTHLNVQPVSTGDTVTLDVVDIHENGAGIGKTENGFVILLEGVLPPKKVEARVTEVKQSFAYGKVQEVLEEELSETDEDENNDETEEDEERERLGSRENHWG